MTVYLKGLGLRNYRGIGPKTQYMAPFKNFNFFIGANNSGKSAVLNFINEHLPVHLRQAYLSRSDAKPVNELTVYARGEHGPITASFPVSTSAFLQDLQTQIRNTHSSQQVLEAARKLVNEMGRGGFIWFESRLPFEDKLTYVEDIDHDRLTSVLNEREWQNLWSVLTRQSGGGMNHWFKETIDKIRNVQTYPLPEVRLIPAIRQIDISTFSEGDFSGRGLINRLAELQNPRYNRQEDRSVFDQINKFLKVVTDRPEARIEIPHGREEISVHMNGQVLPLASLGTGIHEVVMIAAYCTLTSEMIMCIEEPEIHLHPILQRKLIRYLQDNTDNQYFIATHSASFIDTEGAAIFHVTHDGNQTFISESILRQDRYNICVTLGHRASDIVQANFVIWVEGPTERIYIKHWIGALNADLVEGIHYSIMFYGGRLLSHLSADDEEVDAFISLRSLNQNLAVVMDSDKEGDEDTINETKQRILDEFRIGRGMAWLTAGREIENYINPDTLQEALGEMYPNIYDRRDTVGPYDHAFYFRRKEPVPQPGTRPTTLKKDADKVKLARKVCDRPADLSVLDLHERMLELVALIEAAND